MQNKFHWAAIAISVFLIQGCADSTSSSVAAASGTVIDGYIEGAKVCADLNENHVCDPGEPTTTTDANGAYTLSDTGGAKYVIVETTSSSKDKDDGGKTLAEAGREPFSLSAPTTLAEGQEKFVITPLTTMVVTAMKEDPTLTPTTAGVALVKQMGLADPGSINMFEDYKAKGNTQVALMAKGISDAMGEAEKLAKTEAGGELGSLKKDVMKDIQAKTWNAMVANISPDGKMIKPPSEFRDAVKTEVKASVQTVVTAAKFTPDKTFMEKFDVKSALAIKENGAEVKGKQRLYVAGCSKREYFSNKGISTQSIQKIFCPSDSIATLSSVEVGDSSPWPVPQANVLVGSSLSNSKWYSASNGDNGNFYILTDKGLELFDGDPNTDPKPFRPRTANPTAPTITSKFDAQCFSVSASGYGEKYCFDPVKLEGKKVSSLEPSCKNGYTDQCSISEKNDKTFDASSVGFNVKMSYMYDTYQFFKAKMSNQNSQTSTTQSSTSDQNKSSEGATTQPSTSTSGQSSNTQKEQSSFATFSEAIAQAKQYGKNPNICDSDLTGGVSYFFKFLDKEQIQLTGMSGPYEYGSCYQSDAPSLPITSEIVLCDSATKTSLFGQGVNNRVTQAFEQLCASATSSAAAGAFNQVKITQEIIGYSVLKPNTSAAAKDIEVFRTSMFGIVKLITKNIKPFINDDPRDLQTPSGFAATLYQGNFMLGVYWAKDTPVWKLSFMDGKEKVFNDAAGKFILETFGAPNFEPANIVVVSSQ